MGVVQRLNQFIELKGISKYKFYQKTGLSNGALDKGDNLGSDKCEKIHYAFPEINLVWLLTGQGDMLINDRPSTPVEIPAPDNNEASVYCTNELSMRFKQAYDYLLSNGFIAGNKDFAAKIGVSTSMITEIFKGRSNVGATALQNIVSVFKIDANWLFTGLGTMVINNEVVKLADSKESSVYYNMYKEEKAENKALIKEIGALEQQVKILEKQLEDLGFGETRKQEASAGSTRTRKSGVVESENAQFAGQH